MPPTRYLKALLERQRQSPESKTWSECRHQTEPQRGSRTATNRTWFPMFALEVQQHCQQPLFVVSYSYQVSRFEAVKIDLQMHKTSSNSLARWRRQNQCSPPTQCFRNAVMTRVQPQNTQALCHLHALFALPDCTHTVCESSHIRYSMIDSLRSTVIWKLHILQSVWRIDLVGLRRLHITGSTVSRITLVFGGSCVMRRDVWVTPKSFQGSWHIRICLKLYSLLNL